MIGGEQKTARLIQHYQQVGGLASAVRPIDPAECERGLTPIHDPAINSHGLELQKIRIFVFLR